MLPSKTFKYVWRETSPFETKGEKPRFKWFWRKLFLLQTRCQQRISEVSKALTTIIQANIQSSNSFERIISVETRTPLGRIPLGERVKAGDSIIWKLPRECFAKVFSLWSLEFSKWYYSNHTHNYKCRWIGAKLYVKINLNVKQMFNF